MAKAPTQNQPAQDTAPVAAPSPFNLDAWRCDDVALGVPGTSQPLNVVPVRKPGKQEFIRVHPDYQLPVQVIELDDERETYLVAPNMVHRLNGETKPKLLRLAVSRAGSVFLWPLVPASAESTSGGSWHTSARAAATRAETQWLRVTSDQAAGMYQTKVADHLEAAPAWPAETFEEIVFLAFPEDRRIVDPGHPVVRRLAGLD